ncbi:MAG: hypothetical protein GC204_03795 [Chloroflexi bacterium]|nr:hypothetical protein [Chloroflexota bacterium]
MPPTRHAGHRRITVSVSADLYASLIVAKTHFRKSLTELTREGLDLIAQRYRRARLAEREAERTDKSAVPPSKLQGETL